MQLDPITSLHKGCVLYDMQAGYLLTDESLHVLGLASVGPMKACTDSAPSSLRRSN